jgi:hypothetical protein
MSTTVQPFGIGLVERFVQPTDVGRPIVRPFSLRVGMVYQPREACAGPGQPFRSLHDALHVTQLFATFSRPPYMADMRLWDR